MAGIGAERKLIRDDPQLPVLPEAVEKRVV
jgi:hypothetical protein